MFLLIMKKNTAELGVKGPFVGFQLPRLQRSMFHRAHGCKVHMLPVLTFQQTPCSRAARVGVAQGVAGSTTEIESSNSVPCDTQLFLWHWDRWDGGDSQLAVIPSCLKNRVESLTLSSGEAMTPSVAYITHAYTFTIHHYSHVHIHM